MPSSLPLLTVPLSFLYRYTQSQVQFNAYVQAETLLNNYAHILDLLTRLRQAIDHPYLVLHSPRGMELDEGTPPADGRAGARLQRDVEGRQGLPPNRPGHSGVRGLGIGLALSD